MDLYNIYKFVTIISMYLNMLCNLELAIKITGICLNVRQESGSRVVFGKSRHSRPPPIKSAATINVGAGQYISSSIAITILPIIPPKRAAIIETATPVALEITKF